MKWEILGQGEIIKTLLKNRGIKNEKEFFTPKFPENIGLKFNKAIERIKKAKVKKEKVIVYGDYDADGICATAIMWEALHNFGLDVLPHIPDRFSEGYGLNAQSVEKLKNSKIPKLKLIITVDNGIVAYEGIKKANELGIDVIVVDHHQKGVKPNSALCILHSTLVSGSALSYFLARELGESSGLELASIGTIADQIPLTGINRSIVKYGLEELNKTKRLGLISLFENSKIDNIGTYEVNYIIAPRINAMGRLSHGLDSLRLLCTKDKDKANNLAKILNETNTNRQKIVDEMITLTLKKVQGNEKIIVIASEEYHEGVIGLAAGKLVEEFYRPAIVISKKGEIAKASARSISGFNIIEAIKSLDELIIEGGGHPMAAGFSIKTENIEIFTKKINEYAKDFLTDEILSKKLKIDLEINFDEINQELVEKIKMFEPFGIGNYAPLFCTKKVEVIESRKVGSNGNHLKLKLKQNSIIFDAIWFNAKPLVISNKPLVINAAFSVEENEWNNKKSIQLKVRDIKTGQ